jgi:acyl-coenzyme A thioesterase PaaI-like protein
MSGAAYEVEGEIARATAHAAGPWHPGLQHGGAPASLIVWAAERVAAAGPMRVARVTVELLRPVPVAPLEIRIATLREGRKIQLVEVRLLDDGREVVRGTVLKVRTTGMPLPRGAILPPLGAPPAAGVPADPDFSFGFAAGFELRRLTERGRLGPARVWFRQHGAIVDGEALSPAMRAAAVGDYSNGIANELPWTDWTFINADLTISLAREPEGEWILSDAESWLAEDGTGLAMTRLADERGTFGRAVQSLLIEPR